MPSLPVHPESRWSHASGQKHRRTFVVGLARFVRYRTQYVAGLGVIQAHPLNMAVQVSTEA